MKWSRYSRLFESRRNGWLLYNAASGSFLRLDPEAAATIREIISAPEAYDFSASPQLYLTLRTGGHLVTDTQDDDFYNILKMRRLTANYASHTMLLTIAVTRACNFACSYCYESNRTGQPMSPEVCENLLKFIDRHQSLSKLAIIWYGGEPLLGLKPIRELSAALDERGRSFEAMIVTNGYLLDDRIIPELNRLHIQRIQITLDGSRETHDQRRYQVSGQGSFDVILGNLDQLMASDYQGSVQIRVNIDMRNRHEFSQVWHMIRERYPDAGNRLIVYPGYVKGEGHPDSSCFFDSSLTGQFVADLARDEGIQAMALYPSIASAGCTLTKRNAYVVGPEGELYKCWDDIGIPDRIIGTIDGKEPWNAALLARGMVGCNYLDAPECRECFYFPVCDGGCHRVRLRNLEDGGHRECCSYFRDHLEDLLEIHYEMKMQKDAEKEETKHA